MSRTWRDLKIEGKDCITISHTHTRDTLTRFLPKTPHWRPSRALIYLLDCARETSCIVMPLERPPAAVRASGRPLKASKASCRDVLGA